MRQEEIPISFFRTSAGRKSVRGFTLIELMVVLAIILTLSTIILSSQSTFNKTLVLANTAYDIALALRSAETYGLGSRGRTNDVGAFVSANAGYGLHFEKAQPGTITLFADAYPAPSTLSVCHPTSDASAPDARPGNCVYDSAQGEKVVDYTLGNGITVSDFCAYAGSWSCANNGSLSSLDIIFSRPNPEPLISTNGSYSGINPPTAACLVIHSPQGGNRFISIGASGQIVANAASDPSSCHE